MAKYRLGDVAIPGGDKDPLFLHTLDPGGRLVQECVPKSRHTVCRTPATMILHDENNPANQFSWLRESTNPNCEFLSTLGYYERKHLQKALPQNPTQREKKGEFLRLQDFCWLLASSAAPVQVI